MTSVRYIVAGACALALTAGAAYADPAANKKAALEFEHGLIGMRNPASVKNMVTADFKDHNGRIEQMGGDWPAVEKFIATMGPAPANAPPARPPLSVVAEGDWVHEVQASNMGGRPGYLFDVYRFTKDGKIAEHWDSMAGGPPPAGGPPGGAPPGAPRPPQ